jgi:D-glycero-D-manno-heptose 1,7-bisphosphate phosphatase
MHNHQPLHPAVFLDRDGTLIEERSYITRPDQVRLLPGAAASVRHLRQAGFTCVVVTNQSAVGKGLISLAELGHIHVEMLRQLRDEGAVLDGLYSCPFSPTATQRDHPDRKPAPGMLLQAARDLGLDLANSWMVGDRESDVLAGRNAGCRESVLVRTGYDVSAVIGFPTEDDMPAVARRILRTMGQETARAA